MEENYNLFDINESQIIAFYNDLMADNVFNYVTETCVFNYNQRYCFNKFPGLFKIVKNYYI